jgi:hypothetical protein
MSRGEARAVGDVELEKDRARYGLLAVVISNLAIAGVAIFGVWRLNGDKSVIVGVLTAAFTAVSSVTTAYLGIKAVSNTARSIALGEGGSARHQAAPAAPPAESTPTPPAEPISTPPAGPTAAPTPTPPAGPAATPPAQRTP